jgi:hypothetical protein
MEVSEFGQLFLGETPFEPKSPHCPTKQSPWIRSWHPAIIESLTTMSLHTISVMVPSSGTEETLSRTPGASDEPIDLQRLSGISTLVRD